MIGRTLIGLGLAISVTACARESMPSSNDRLSDPEIMREIRGHVLSYEDGRTGLDESTTETFYCDGNWLGDGGRVRDEGRYSIENGELCVARFGASPSCRIIMRTADGQVSAAPSTHPEDARRINLAPVAGLDC